MALDLYRHNLLHHQITDDLQRHGCRQHHVADVIGEEELDVVGIRVKHEDCNPNWDASQRGGRHLTVRADGANASTQFETFSNDVGQLVQDFRQVAASTLLQKDGGHKKVTIEQGHTFGQSLKSDVER